jgi:hypothetical protein
MALRVKDQNNDLGTKFQKSILHEVVNIDTVRLSIVGLLCRYLPEIGTTESDDNEI